MFAVYAKIICFAWALVAAAEQQKETKEYHGVFLGDLRNASHGIESGRAYLVNGSAVQVVGLTLKPSGANLRIRFSFSADKEIGKVEEFYELNKEDGVHFVKKPNHLKNTTNGRYFINVPKSDYSQWKSFGIVSEAEWKYLAVVPLSNKTAPQSFCCLPPINGWVYNVKSDPLEILDSRTIKVPKFSFEGQKPPDSWFLVGRGAVDKSNGKKCYIKGRDSKSLWCPIQEEYTDRDMIIHLPEDENVYTIQWLSVYHVDVGVDFGHVEFEMNTLTQPVPPFLPPFGENSVQFTTGLFHQKIISGYDCPLQNYSTDHFVFKPFENKTSGSWVVPIVFAVPEKDKSKWVDLTFTLGPAGGIKAKANRATCENMALVWYVQGEMQPNVYIQRGITYRLKIYGGLENPLYLTDDRTGGWSQKSEIEKLNIKIYDGEKGDSAGDLCVWKAINDTRATKPDSFDTYNEYRHFLNLHCSNLAVPHIMKWTPGNDVPNEIYYESFTQNHMGGKIFICNKLEGDAVKPKCLQ